MVLPLAGTAQAAPDPCAPLKGTPSYDLCKAGGTKEREKEPALGCDDLSGPARENCREREGGAPGNGENDPLDMITGDCKRAPELDGPGEGAAGWFDSGPSKAPAARTPDVGYLYEQYGFGGLTWHTYDLGCGGDLRDPESSTDTWIANAIFGVTKSWTAFTTSLRQQATGEHDFLDELDPVIEQATRGVRDAVFNNWIGTSVVLLGAVIVFQARKRDVSGVVSQVGWALLVMAIATGVASYPVQASKFADDALNTVITTIDQSFANVDLSTDQNGPEAVPASATAPANQMTAHGNMLIRHTLYQHWLRGALGDPNSDVAKKYGPQLLDAQALTWSEDRLPPEQRQKVVEEKQKRWEEIASKVKEEDPSAYGHLTGKKGERVGQAFLSLLSAASANLFSNAADVIIVGAKVMIRFVVVMLPAIAVVGLHRRMAGTMKTGLHSLMAACINVPIFATAAAVDVLAVRTIMGQGLPAWLKILLLLLITWVLWRIVKPLRRLSSMANPNRNWVEDAGSITGVPGKVASTVGKGYLIHRAMRRFGQRTGQAVADELGETLHERDQYRSSGGDGLGVDHGAWDGWADQDTGTSPKTPNPPQPGGTRGGGGGLVLASDTDGSLDTAYESDAMEHHRFATGHDPRRPVVGALPGEGSRRIPPDDVMDVDAWYIEDLDPAARDTHKGLPAPHTSLPAAPPQTSGPQPGGSGGAAAVPSPRTQGAPALPVGVEGAAPAASAAVDRPYVEPTPSVVPPTIDEDGNHVFVIFDPRHEGGGFTVRDDRGPTITPEEESDR
ncbi:hypothetical protein ACH41E_33435 [Streptomyces sp. NPDC020412]|uniref:hypothetical protein n=1 Tax=Streptomyces sp. NPDC020412 TaxID=3365073 RepID=UPI0037B729F4